MSRVLLIGDPRLRQVSTPVEDLRDPAFYRKQVDYGIGDA